MPLSNHVVNIVQNKRGVTLKTLSCLKNPLTRNLDSDNFLNNVRHLFSTIRFDPLQLFHHAGIRVLSGGC